MRNWGAIVRERLMGLGRGAPDAVLVEELAAHLAQIYDEARDEGQSDADATAAAMRVLHAPDLFRHTIDARRPTVKDHVTQWSRQESAPVQKGSWMSAL